MANRWFNVPSETVPDPVDRHDVHRPAHSEQVDSYTGFSIGNSPRFVVRYYADPQTLDSIGAENQVTEITDVAALEFLNSEIGHQSIEDVDAKFNRA